MIKHMIFDCGKVLVTYDEVYIASYFTENAEDAELLGRVGMARKYWDAFDQGTLEVEDYKRAVKAELPERLHENIDRLYDGWIDHCDPIPGMDAIVRGVKEYCDVYLLSNFNKKLRNELYKIPVLADFDALVISAEIGMTKPSEGIYRYLLDTYGLDADECLFVDDNAANIAGCEAVGIRGYLFDGDVEKLAEYLRLIGCLAKEV
ncbi:MAG: HAD family phosphatase [Clostridia bacterium]|nr:HAD family phosphatase [Clostridia bacterium]